VNADGAVSGGVPLVVVERTVSVLTARRLTDLCPGGRRVASTCNLELESAN
jgi:hypothetical protein